MYRNTLLFIFVVLGAVTPLVTKADPEADFTYIINIANLGIGVLALLIPVLIGLGLVFFFWGLVLFIANSGEEKGREEGKQKMIWGIVALFVMVSVWGFVALVQQLTGIDGTHSLSSPKTPS
jgi:hypothetical protein